MDWADLTEFYEDRLVLLKPFPKLIAELEFTYLTNCVTLLFPEALDNALLFVASGKEAISKKLTGDKLETNLAFRRSGDAFSITYEILERYKLMPEFHEKLNADKHDLHSQQVVYCFAEWLREQEWEVEPGMMIQADYDLMATKDKVNMFALGIGTPNTYISAADSEKEAKNKFKKIVADKVFTLLEKMNTIPISPALVLPDDRKTREFMKHYTPVSRLGITLFWVKSMAEVSEI